MAVFAVLNGSICEVVLIPRTGEYPGHVLSTALLVGAILAVAGLYFRRTSIEYSQREFVLVGVLWTVLTVSFWSATPRELLSP